MFRSAEFLAQLLKMMRCDTQVSQHSIYLLAVKGTFPLHVGRRVVGMSEVTRPFDLKTLTIHCRVY